MFDFIDQYEAFGLSLRHWIIILVALFFILAVLFWAFTPREQPKIVSGKLDGVYDAKIKFFDGLAPLDASVCERPEKCYNNSWIIFTGNITYDSGFGSRSEYVRLQKMEGLIDITWREGRILESDTQNFETPITANFKGVIQPPFLINWQETGRTIFDISIVAFLIWYIKLRKIRRDDNDVERAKLAFRKHCRLPTNMYTIVGQTYVGKPERMGGTKIRPVGADVKFTDGTVKFLTATVKGDLIESETPDEDGSLKRAFFSKEGLEYQRLLERERRQHTPEEMMEAYRSGQQFANEARAKTTGKKQQPLPEKMSPDEIYEEANKLLDKKEKPKK